MNSRRISCVVMIVLVILSTMVAVDASDSSQTEKALGMQTTIVILVEFSDVKHTLSKEQVYDLIIDKMNAYAKEASYNLTWFIGNTTSQWYQLPNPISYYAPWAARLGEPHWEREGQFIRTVIHMVDGEVDFSQYKRVIIVHAGSGGFPPYAFGVSWYFCCSPEDSVTTNDGVTLNELVVDAELDPPSVVVHEWLHHLGGRDRYGSRVKDLYDWNLLSKGEYAPIYVGMWDLMSGQWGNEPQGLLSWTKLQLGWLSPSRVADVKPGEAVTLKVDPLELPSIGIQAISIPLSDGRYYLVEVRQKIGYDAMLPDFGALVTLCDDRIPSAEGPVRVQDANPNTATLDDATLDLSIGKQAGFFDRKNDVSIVVTGKSGLSYTVFAGPTSQGEVALAQSQKALNETVYAQLGDPTNDLFDRNGKPADAEAYLDIVSVVVKKSAESYAFEIVVNGPMPERIDSSLWIEWDIAVDTDNNPSTGWRSPLFYDDIGVDYLIRVGMRDSTYDPQIMRTEPGFEQTATPRYYIQDNKILLTLTPREFQVPSDLIWMATISKHGHRGEPPNPPLLAGDKAPNTGHFTTSTGTTESITETTVTTGTSFRATIMPETETWTTASPQLVSGVFTFETMMTAAVVLLIVAAAGSIYLRRRRK